MGTFFKIFPHAKIDLRGDVSIINAPENKGVVINKGHINAIAPSCLDSVMDKILSSEELSAEEKIKVLKVLKK